MDDILEEIPLLKVKLAKKNNIDLKSLSSEEMKIINCLISGEKTVYEIKFESGLETSISLSLLTILEMKGYVRQLPGNKFILNK